MPAAATLPAPPVRVLVCVLLEPLKRSVPSTVTSVVSVWLPVLENVPDSVRLLRFVPAWNAPGRPRFRSPSGRNHGNRRRVAYRGRGCATAGVRRAGYRQRQIATIAAVLPAVKVVVPESVPLSTASGPPDLRKGSTAERATGSQDVQARVAKRIVVAGRGAHIGNRGRDRGRSAGENAAGVARCGQAIGS